jgi:hypothetical protein
MSRTRVALSELLNPDEDHPSFVDIRPQLRQLADYTMGKEPVLVLPALGMELNALLERLECRDAMTRSRFICHPPLNRSSSEITTRTHHSQSPSDPDISRSPSPTESSVTIYQNVKLNRQTLLKTLYCYSDPTYLLEYPATSEGDPTGHLLCIDPKSWANPLLNVIYSCGEPSGRTQEGKSETCSLLFDSDTKEEVPCQVMHCTCAFQLFSSVFLLIDTRPRRQGLPVHGGIRENSFSFPCYARGSPSKSTTRS